MNTPDVEWRPIPGWEGCYEVSTLGHVRTLSRFVHRSDGTSRWRPGRVLKFQTTHGRYLTVGLWRDDKQTSSKVHQLVAAAFLGPRPEGMVVRHLDGNPFNNVASNLAYGTVSQNSMDSVRHGSHFYASRTSCSAGHEYRPGSYSIARGRRRCKECTRNANARARLRKVRAA